MEGLEPVDFELKLWKIKLDRKLLKKEKKIIINAKHEYFMNISINDVQKRLNKLGFKISNLSGLYGNCLYESIGFDVGDHYKIIKKKVRSEMKRSKDKEIINNSEMTLSGLFDIYNEIEFVKVNGVRTKYTYDLMLIDLLQNNGWQRMPTEILLNVLSRIYNKKIIIFHTASKNGLLNITVIDNVKKEDMEITEPATESISEEENNSAIDFTADDKERLKKQNKKNDLYRDESDTEDMEEDDSDDETQYDENTEEVQVDDEFYDNVKTYDLTKFNLTYDIIKDSIKLALIEETHYVPVNNIVNNDKNISVYTIYNEDIEKFKMFKSINKEKNNITMNNMSVNNTETQSTFDKDNEIMTRDRLNKLREARIKKFTDEEF